MEGEIDKEFKGILTLFLSENMRSCTSLVRSIKNSETYEDLKITFKNYAEDIADSLGIEVLQDCRDCEKKESEIEELNHKLLFRSFTPKTLNDEFKLEAFLRNKDKFSVSDLESLFD